ncbi:hypothetical protein PSJE_24025 [Pseudomonas jessenii]|nr:hypothetical protein PSJE_24025 [Pseudomonas jessenii]
MPPCGSELARDGGLAFNIDVEWYGPIASKLAPTGFWVVKRSLFNGCQCYLMKATPPCVIAYRYARIRRLVRLGPPR